MYIDDVNGYWYEQFYILDYFMQSRLDTSYHEEWQIDDKY